jgi:hypothetical protein
VFNSPYLAPYELTEFVHVAATEEADAYLQSLTDEELNEYWDELHGYFPKYSYGDKEDLFYFVSEALVNPDWVTPDLFTVVLPSPVRQGSRPRRPRRPAR